jgi:predicted PurR-regulated permease PerM
MKDRLLLVGVALSILVAASVTNNAVAQNLTTNASNAAGNMSVSTNQTMSELGQNASTALNKTGESANATMSELGKNVTDAGKTALNKTGEVLQGVGSGAASVLGNITGEIKEGISGK